MNYILKQFDEPLVKFSATTDTSEPEIQILWTNEEKAALLPLDLTLTPDLSKLGQANTGASSNGFAGGASRRIAPMSIAFWQNAA